MSPTARSSLRPRISRRVGRGGPILHSAC